MKKDRIIRKIKGASISVLLLLSLLTILVTPAFSDFEPQAGLGIVSMSASSNTLTIGDTFNVTIYVDTGADPTRGLTIRILLFNDSSLGIANINPHSALLNTTYIGGWASAPQQDGGKLHNDTGNITYIMGGDALGAGYTGNNSVLLINMTAEKCGILNITIPSTAPWNPAQAGVVVDDVDSTSWYNTSIIIYPSTDMTLTATPYNYTIINLTYNLPTGADSVWIERNTTASWDRGEAIFLDNSTNLSYNDTELNECATYYYQAWSWNASSHLWSATPATTYATTQCHTNFTFAGVTPTNSSVTTNCTYDIPINLTIINSRGRAFSYWINASNGQTTSGAGQAANTSVGRTLTSLSHRTNYEWNVTAVDDTGSGDTYTQTYNFTTGNGGGTAPVVDSPCPNTGNSSVPVGLGTFSVHVTDADGDVMNTTFYWADGTMIGGDSSTISGGTATISPTLSLNHNTTYQWYAKVYDSCLTTTSTTWSFTTDVVNVSITKEWYVLADNSIFSWINVTNIGEVDLTNVNITDTFDANLVYGGCTPLNDSAVYNSWTIASLTQTGASKWYNISLFQNLSGQLANGTIISNYVTSSVNYTIEAAAPADLTMAFYATKESLVEILDWNSTSCNWSINVTNSGDFYLNWIQVNETYSPNLTYHSSNIAPSNSNQTFNITQVAPGATSHLWILMNTSYIAGNQLVNGSKIWNNISIDSNETAPQVDFTNYVYAGAITTQIRIHYTTQFTDVVDITNTIFLILGAAMIIGLIIGVIYVFYRYKGGAGEE